MKTGMARRTTRCVPARYPDKAATGEAAAFFDHTYYANRAGGEPQAALHTTLWRVQRLSLCAAMSGVMNANPVILPFVHDHIQSV